MKTLTNKLVMSVLALVLTGVALSVGVFAWFTINNTAAVDQFSANIQTGDGFYVSANGSTWKNTLTNTDLGSAITGKTFKPLHTEDGLTFNSLTDGVTLGAAEGSSYIEFTLLFVGSNALGTIQLSNIEISSATSTSWIPGVALAGTPSAEDANTAIVQYAANAARVSFQDLADAAHGTTIIEREASAEGNSLGKGEYADNPAIIYYNHFMTPDLNQVFFDDSVADNDLKPAGASYTVANMSTTEPTLPGSMAYTVPTSVTNVIGEVHKYGAITIRVWIDGWDQEAFNSILSGQFTVSFSFTAINLPIEP